MRVALIQIDGKMPNLALLKLSAWHKKRGDEVVYIDLSSFEFDRLYGSKIFMGGPGYDLKSTLPDDIEHEVPDYEQFKMDHSVGFTSRGCIRDCGFCIVREKEGTIHETADPSEFVKHDKVILMDNNFLATPKWKEKLEWFIERKIKVSFNSGLDIRLINEENAKLLKKVKAYDWKFKRRTFYFSFDDPALEPIVKEKLTLLKNVGIKGSSILVYVLVGYNTTIDQDLKRVKLLVDEGCIPFVMVFNNRKDDLELRKLARWTNKRYYRVIPWETYRERNRT